MPRRSYIYIPLSGPTQTQREIGRRAPSRACKDPGPVWLILAAVASRGYYNAPLSGVPRKKGEV